MKKMFREPMNGLTHFAGFLLAIAALIILVIDSVSPLRIYHLISFMVFGIGLIMMYASSTLYHWLVLSERGTANMRKLDHVMIYITIAATYTPVCIIPLHGATGWILFSIMWAIAVTGICFSIVWITAPRWLSTGFYIFMGWVAVFVSYPLIQVLPAGALWWLLIGGLFYTTGAVIYGIKKPNLIPGWLGFHEIFHIFVLLGSASHFWVMYNYIAKI